MQNISVYVYQTKDKPICPFVREKIWIKEQKKRFSAFFKMLSKLQTSYCRFAKPGQYTDQLIFFFPDFVITNADFIQNVL